MNPHFILVEQSVLGIQKSSLTGIIDHYYLSENQDFNHSIGWGSGGLEVRGRVRVTTKEIARVEQFVAASAYNVAVNNCEHFANYVLHGINVSSQVDHWWKNLGAEVFAILQPTQSKRDNVSDYIGHQVAGIFEENLKQARIMRANKARLEFWQSRGIPVD